jgi:hypothetical protein
MRSSRPQKTRAQDDECGVRRDPHGFKKRGLRMTSVVSEEILTRKSTAQDDRMKGTPPLILLNGGNH